MTPKFERLADTWKAHADGVSIFIDDQGGQPEPTQLAIASRLAADLAAVRSQGASYLDAFVDRQKACGSPGEEWWLDEIEMRGMPRDNPRVSLFFTLHGDGDGQWTVEMRALSDRFHPIRFERRQG
jgi:hypothetical protein